MPTLLSMPQSHVGGVLPKEPFLLLVASYMPALDKVCLRMPAGRIANPARGWKQVVADVLRATTGDTPYIESVQVAGTLAPAHYQGSAVRSPHLAPEGVKVLSAVISRWGYQFMTHPHCGLRNGPNQGINLNNVTALPATDNVRRHPHAGPNALNPGADATA